MSFPRFLIADAVAALITAPLMLGIGYLFAQNYQLLKVYVNQVKVGLLIGGIITLIGIGLYMYRRHKRKELLVEEDQDDEAAVEAEIQELEASASSQTPKNF
jgi:hypothetical protein